MNAQFEPLQDRVTTVVDTTTVQSEIPAAEQVRVEEFKINRNRVVTFAKELFRRGKIRQVVIQNKQGKKLVEIPLPIALIGLGASVVVFPVTALVGTIVVLATNPTVVIEREE